jgi:hypothetical protein
MASASTSGRWAPFPPIPAALAQAFDLRDLRLRRFGTTADDFAVDFDASPPHVVTAILAQCTERSQGPLPEHFLWALGVGARIACLLQLVALEGGDTLAASSRCANAACNESMEIDLSIAELLALQQDRAEGPIEVEVDGARLLLRRPTGLDQLELRKLFFADQRAARRGVMRALVVEGTFEPTEDQLGVIESALDDGDPLVDFSLTVECPGCRQSSRQTVDLARLALRRLRRAQNGLIETVHLLASRYHWSETQILSIPPWRRAHYLALIDREGVR